MFLMIDNCSRVFVPRPFTQVKVIPGVASGSSGVHYGGRLAHTYMEPPCLEEKSD